MYLQAVSRSSTHISEQQLAEIEKRKEEVKQVVRSGSVRDSRVLFEAQDSTVVPGTCNTTHTRTIVADHRYLQGVPGSA